MGQKDTVTKDYIRNAEVFADAFNYLLYGGEKVIIPESLHELDSTATTIIHDDSLNAELIQRYRDSLKYMTVMEKNDAVYVILGIENQSHVHYAMPVKNMLYDAMEYANQVKKVANGYRKAKNTSKMNVGEFLTGFSKNDELIPVITLVLYLGTDPWDGPRSLYEMFGGENEKILPFVSDYKINLIEPQRMSDEEINRFHTDLREVLLYSDMLPPLKSLILKWGLLAQWLYRAKYLQAILACPAIFISPVTDFLLCCHAHSSKILFPSFMMLTAAFTSRSILLPHSQ